jgi:hypothetical protein
MKELIREHSGNYCQTCTVKDSVKIGLCSRCIAESASYSLQEKKRDPLIDTMIDSNVTWDSITAIMNDVIIHNIPLPIAIANEIKRINFSDYTEGLQDLKHAAFSLTGNKIQQCDICTDINHFMFASCNSCEVNHEMNGKKPVSGLEYTDNDRFIGYEVYPNHYGIPCFAFPVKENEDTEYLQFTGYNKNGL